MKILVLFFIKLYHQGEFWKIQDVRSSKMSLVDQFDAFLAKILEVKGAYSRKKLY